MRPVEGGGESSHLDSAERQKVEEEEKISAAVTHEVIRRAGVKELSRAPSALAWSGLAGGLGMALVAVTQSVLHAALPDAVWRPLVTSFGYPVGFLVVILGSQHLYTENTLTPMVPLLADRGGAMLRKVLRLWGIVLLANLLGGFLFAWVAARTVILPDELRQAMRALAVESMGNEAATTFARAIVAGWIVALMVWMLPAASESQVLVIIIMTWLIGAARLAHVIVGSVEASYLIVLGDLPVSRAFASYFLPALLGNTIGGVTLVAALNHGQVESA